MHGKNCLRAPLQVGCPAKQHRTFSPFFCKEGAKHYIWLGIISRFSRIELDWQLLQKYHKRHLWRWIPDLLTDACIVMAKLSRNSLKKGIKCIYLVSKNIFHEIPWKLLGPQKNYFMLKASLYSDNIGLFYDILSIDVPIACKKPTRFKWTKLTWNGENVDPK